MRSTGQGYTSGNSHNGNSPKSVKTESVGDLALFVPRDPNANFDPGVNSQPSHMKDKLEGMFGQGMTTPDIEGQIAKILPVFVSAWIVSNITNKLLGNIRAWLVQHFSKRQVPMELKLKRTCGSFGGSLSHIKNQVQWFLFL